MRTVLCLGYGRGCRGIVVCFPAGASNLPLFQIFQTGSGTQSVSYSMGTEGFLPGGLSGRDVKLTAYFHLVPTLRMRGAIPPLPDISSWGIQDDTTQLYFYCMYCVLVLRLRPAIIMNNKVKSVTETEKGKCDFGCLTRVFAVLTDVDTSVTYR